MKVFIQLIPSGDLWDRMWPQHTTENEPWKSSSIMSSNAQLHDSASGLSMKQTWSWLNHVNQIKEKHFQQIFLVTKCGPGSCSSHESLKTKAEEQELPRLKSFHSAEPKLITAPGEHRGFRNQSARMKTTGEFGFEADLWDGENRWMTSEEERRQN